MHRALIADFGDTVGKVCGTVLGWMYAERYDMSVIRLRIGAARQKPPYIRGLHAWLSNPDWVCLVGCSLDAPPNSHFDIVYGVSANTRLI